MSILGIICLIYGILIFLIGIPMVKATPEASKFLMDKLAPSDGRLRLTSSIFSILGLGMIILAWSHDKTSELFIFWSGWAILLYNIWGVLLPFFGRAYMEGQLRDFKRARTRFVGITLLFWGIVFSYLGLKVV